VGFSLILELLKMLQ